MLVVVSPEFSQHSVFSAEVGVSKGDPKHFSRVLPLQRFFLLRWVCFKGAPEQFSRVLPLQRFSAEVGVF